MLSSKSLYPNTKESFVAKDKCVSKDLLAQELYGEYRQVPPIKVFLKKGIRREVADLLCYYLGRTWNGYVLKESAKTTAEETGYSISTIKRLRPLAKQAIEEHFPGALIMAEGTSGKRGTWAIGCGIPIEVLRRNKGVGKIEEQGDQESALVSQWHDTRVSAGHQTRVSAGHPNTIIYQRYNNNTGLDYQTSLEASADASRSSSVDDSTQEPSVEVGPPGSASKTRYYYDISFKGEVISLPNSVAKQWDRLSEGQRSCVVARVEKATRGKSIGESKGYLFKSIQNEAMDTPEGGDIDYKEVAVVMQTVTNKPEFISVKCGMDNFGVYRRDEHFDPSTKEWIKPVLEEVERTHGAQHRRYLEVELEKAISRQRLLAKSPKSDVKAA